MQPEYLNSVKEFSTVIFRRPGSLILYIIVYILVFHCISGSFTVVLVFFSLTADEMKHLFTILAEDSLPYLLLL